MTDAMTVGVVFGGRSVEHEVSVITAQQAIAVLRQKYRVVPLYVTKSGAWYTGDRLTDLAAFNDMEGLLQSAPQVSPLIDPSHPGRLTVVNAKRGGLFSRGGDETVQVDVVLPLIHGTYGEDGTLAGLCELWGVPYAGCGVTAAALAMDKPLAKRIFRDAGIPVLDDVVITRDDWQKDRDAAVGAITRTLAYPLFVKPATLGSSIGVAPAADEDALRDAIDLAVVYDARVMIEPQQERMAEINVSVLGRGGDVRASVCEQPVSEGVLSYADKYAGGGKGGKKTASAGAKGMKSLSRVIPAPIDDSLRDRIQGYAMDAFRLLGAAGVARIDFIVRAESGDVFLNEVNPIPGSLAFYLWEPAGVGYTELLDLLLAQARAAHEERATSVHSIDPWLLGAASRLGSKSGG